MIIYWGGDMEFCEKVLEGFEPDFKFEPASPIPREDSKKYWIPAIYLNSYDFTD